MTFPNSDRVIYSRNPLDSVICQVRFPPILRIETEIPTAFQERIRKDFPEYIEKEEVLLPLGLISRADSPKPGDEILGQIIPSRTRSHQFVSEDGNWQVNLTRNFLALSTRVYIRREDFRDRFSGPLNALKDIYEPLHFSRVGLRYIDVIKRSELELQKVEWGQLLIPGILGLVCDQTVSRTISSYESKCEINLDDESSIARIRAAIVHWEDRNNEECFRIDTDFFDAHKIAIQDVSSKLEYFYEQASRLIQWVIKSELHEAMHPERVL